MARLSVAGNAFHSFLLWTLLFRFNGPLLGNWRRIKGAELNSHFRGGRTISNAGTGKLLHRAAFVSRPKTALKSVHDPERAVAKLSCCYPGKRNETQIKPSLREHHVVSHASSRVSDG